MTKGAAGATGNIPKKRTATDWQVLLVDQYGRIIRIRHLRWFVALISLVMIAALTAVVFLASFLVQSRDANQALTASMSTNNERISTLVDEKDFLLARLVIMKNLLMEENPEAVTDIFHDMPPPERAAGPEAVITVEQGSEASSVSEDKKDPYRPSEVVDIRQLSVTREPGDGLLSIQFQVHNIDDTSEENLSGRIFVVLEEGPGLEEGRLVAPEVELEKGIPVRIDKGDYFSIARFKPVTLTARAAHPEKLTRAVVLVFSTEGEMLYKNDFAIEVTLAPAA